MYKKYRIICNVAQLLRSVLGVETASEMRSRYNPELGIVLEKQCYSDGSVVSH